MQSYSDGLSVVYQMTGAEVRHSAGYAVSLFLSLSLFPYSRSRLVGSRNTHTHLSATELCLAHQQRTMTVSSDRPISRSSPSYIPLLREFLMKEWDGGERCSCTVAPGASYLFHPHRRPLNASVSSGVYITVPARVWRTDV